MKVGAEPKKVAILAALLIAGLIVLYYNVFAGDSEPKTPPVRVAPAVSVPVITPLGVPAAGRAERRRTSKNGVTQEFTFREGTAPGEEKPDPATIDPTLRLDLLAKLQKVDLPASLRNIFQYGAAPPPPTAAKPVELPKNTPKIAINQPPPKPPGPPPAPPAPIAPAITWKYYGYKVSKSDGRKQAFLLDGEDIIIAGENDSVKLGRYKVVRIGVSSITIEDTQFKSTQTLQLQPDAVA
jgi:hypothetical protein